VLAAFFLAGIVFMLSGAAAGVLNVAGALGSWGHWLALHLVLLGGVSLLILGAGQFFAAAFLATDPPPRWMVRAQLATWSAGTIVVAVGVSSGLSSLTAVGGAAIIAGLALFAAALRGLERRSLRSARWAIRWYYACAASLGLGALVGIALARGVVWTHGSLLGAHLALNLAGWLGAAIVGTLHTFYPSLTQTALRHPRLQGPAFATWTTGVAGLAAGYAFSTGVAIVFGWSALAAGAMLLAVNTAAGALNAVRPLSLAARLVGVAQAFLVAGSLVALAAIVADGPYAPLYGDWRAALAVLLLAGWVGLTVAGSLLHLLGVLHRVRHLSSAMPAARPASDLLITLVAAGSVTALALSRANDLGGVAAAAAAALVAAAAVLGSRIVMLAARAVRSARLRL
jgi:nitrite reductase (NO-forming)